MIALLLAAALAAPAADAPSLSLQEDASVPGGLLVLDVRGVDRPGALHGAVVGQKLHFWTAGPHHQRAIIGFSLEQEPGPIPVEVDLRQHGQSQKLTATATVKPKEFHKSELSVAPKFVKPPKSEQAHIEADTKAISLAYHGVKFGPAAFHGKLSLPRDAELTAHFGDQRIYNHVKKNPHRGTDFDGKIGEPIRAIADGTVILARDCYYSGNTTIVAHGGRLYSSYFHQSRMDVKPGDHVKRGQVLGLVGKTGRVTGPHLHLGFKVGERLVDAEEAFKLDLGLDDGAKASFPELEEGAGGTELPDGGVIEPPEKPEPEAPAEAVPATDAGR